MHSRVIFIVVVVLCTAAYLLSPLPGQSAPTGKRIEQERDDIQRQQMREGVLSTTIQRFSTRVRSLDAQLAQTRSRQRRVEVSLAEARQELGRVRGRLRRARDKLERAKQQLRTSRAGLRERLIELYKADQPDLLTVVLNADGFEDLLERTDFLSRVAAGDRQVIGRVRRDKQRAERAERTLASLEARKRNATQVILGRRNDLVSVGENLASTQMQFARARDSKAAVLRRVRGSRQRAQEDLASLEREQQKVQARLAAAARAPAATGRGTSSPNSGRAPAPAPVRRGGGQFIWPINGPLGSPFGPRWGRLHAGIDISAPGGTPIRAAASGRVTIAAMTGGYGNYTCIQHGGALSTCYAHQSRLGTSVGANVRQGQVMGFVGNTGHSFGNHLHFEVRQDGTPVDPVGYL